MVDCRDCSWRGLEYQNEKAQNHFWIFQRKTNKKRSIIWWDSCTPTFNCGPPTKQQRYTNFWNFFSPSQSVRHQQSVRFPHFVDWNHTSDPQWHKKDWMTWWTAIFTVTFWRTSTWQPSLRSSCRPMTDAGRPLGSFKRRSMVLLAPPCALFFVQCFYTALYWYKWVYVELTSYCGDFVVYCWLIEHFILHSYVLACCGLKSWPLIHLCRLAFCAVLTVLAICALLCWHILDLGY